MTRTRILIGLAVLVIHHATASAAESPVNLAPMAATSTSYVSGHETITALNDGFTPAHSDDKSHGAYGNWPQSGTQWVEYQWDMPISTDKIDVYWFDDSRGVRLPKACRVKYWNGDAYVEVENPSGLGLERNRFNTTAFAKVKTTRLRLEMDSQGKFSTGILDWRVLDSGDSPNFAPVVRTGVDRVVVLPGKTHLSGTVRDDGKPSGSSTLAWSKQSGPGEVTFGQAGAPETTAAFSAPGQYDGQLTSEASVQVTVEPTPPAAHLTPVTPRRYSLQSPLWNDRIKKVIINWIPHCYQKLSEPDLKEGGINNFIAAAERLAGKRDVRGFGPPWSDAYVHNTVESICLALMVDPQGDADIVAAQKAMREKLEDWIPRILAAQEPDGYLQTHFTIPGNREHWSPRFRGDHEGYTAGYFIESAIAHYLMTGKTDRRMIDAARKLADCWCANIGPAPKKPWYDGHEELEQALVRLGRFVDAEEGPGKGRKYIDLAKFLLDCRHDGSEYDQSHVPVVRQYEAVGHAVRAVYCYSAIADVAMETGDVDYHSAARSLWASIVHRKYYVTGGVGSGETSEGFGPEYSLGNNAYCESCAGCGELFFQHKLNLTCHDASFADLYEDTLYNAVLGSLDLEGKTFTYTNALDSGGKRYLWHVCPCCVGNIPRTLLMLPSWMYATSADGLYVNLYLGSTTTVDGVAGSDVRVEQKTDYPWSGKVSITVHPSAARDFAVRLRVPRRDVSQLYTVQPPCEGLVSLAVNGQPVPIVMESGYALLKRTWHDGDRIDLVLPMKVQRVKATERIKADVGRVALRYGPLVYNLESVDQDVEQVLPPDSPLSTEWKPDLLGGVMVIHGKLANGKSMTAIPNYARNNREGRSVVWVKDR
jgi:DUF1680 family protein